jgi:hypothetical protein
MNTLRTALSEGDGQISSTRVALLCIVLAVIANWTGACWWPKTVTLVPLPESLVALIVGAMGAKAWQRGRES